MTSDRVLVSDALDEGQLALLVARVESPKSLVEAAIPVERPYLLLPMADLLARAVVAIVAVGHHRRQPVVAARELDEDQTALVVLVRARERSEVSRQEAHAHADSETMEEEASIECLHGIRPGVLDQARHGGTRHGVG